MTPSAPWPGAGLPGCSQAPTATRRRYSLSSHTIRAALGDPLSMMMPSTIIAQAAGTTTYQKSANKTRQRLLPKALR